MERAELTIEDWIHETCLFSAVTSGPTEPRTFQEAWHSPVEEERHNWQVLEGNKDYDQQRSLEEDRQSEDTRK